tara:strand:+ start:137395 stop:138075 length:681 start_codon:yes stop_codon:yes gene_type:complete
MAKKLTKEERELKEKEKLKVTTQSEVKEIIEKHPDFGWYILQTYSGKEAAAKRSVEERLKTNDREDGVGIVLMPEKVFSELRNNGMKKIKRKLYPAYLFIYAKKMDSEEGFSNLYMDELVYSSIKNASNISSFVGQENDGLPKAIGRVDVVTMINQLPVGDEVEQTVKFEIGRKVKIAEGPFQDCVGEITEVFESKGKLKVNISMFNKVTPIDVSFSDVYIGEEVE